MSSDELLPSVIELDLARSRRGLASRSAELLGGEPVVARGYDAACKARSIAPPVVLVREQELEQARRLLGERRPRFFVHNEQDLPQRDELRRARKWGKEGWRGGLRDSFFLCEQSNPRALAGLFEEQDWHAVLRLPADAPFLDAELIDELVDGYLEAAMSRRVYVSTGPPGLAGDVVTREVNDLLAERQLSFDVLLGFRPDVPDRHPEGSSFHHFAESITGARARFIVDSGAALAWQRKLWEEHSDSTAHERLAWCREHPDLIAGESPEEIILDLGGDDFNEALWERILQSIAARDDTLLTFGDGVRDPFANPTLAARIREAREHGVHGVHVRTDGGALDAQVLEEVLAADPDVISVEADAPDQESWERRGANGPPWQHRMEGLERLLAVRGSNPAPLVVVACAFDEITMNRFEGFFDQWYGKVNRILPRGIEGPRGEKLPGSAGVFAPPDRFACGRLTTQLKVEADGRVPLCSRDPEHEVPLGSLATTEVSALWQGAALQQARRDHQEGCWDRVGHCGNCVSWFRLD